MKVRVSHDVVVDLMNYAHHMDIADRYYEWAQEKLEALTGEVAQKIEKDHGISVGDEVTWEGDVWVIGDFRLRVPDVDENEEVSFVFELFRYKEVVDGRRNLVRREIVDVEKLIEEQKGEVK